MFIILKEDNIFINVNLFVPKNSIYEQEVSVPIFGSENIANEAIDYMKFHMKNKAKFSLNKIIFAEDNNIGENQNCYIVLNNIRDSFLECNRYVIDYSSDLNYSFVKIIPFMRFRYNIDIILLPKIPYFLSEELYCQKIYLVEYE